MNPRKLNPKQACMLAFIAYDNLSIFTIIAIDVSGVTILIDTDLMIQQAFMICIQAYG